ncbi:MAG: GNAT family protein [Actinomycetota bacterium]|nr:GNAT family protein [Actinomycetota bacterium]
MTHPIWPLFDLRVSTPRLELRYIDDELAAELSLLAAQGVHDPSFMPFAFEWTDVPSPQLERNTMQFYWRTRADLGPAAWNLNFAVIVEGAVVGTTGLMASQFAVTRVFETGSWLGRAHQGQGLGKEMRIAALQLGFDGFGAHVATTAAFDDNGPSLGVTRSLGYTANGHARKVRRGEPAITLLYELTHERFAATLQRDDIRLHGVPECLPLLGLA